MEHALVLPVSGLRNLLKGRSADRQRVEHLPDLLDIGRHLAHRGAVFLDSPAQHGILDFQFLDALFEGQLLGSHAAPLRLRLGALFGLGAGGALGLAGTLDLVSSPGFFQMASPQSDGSIARYSASLIPACSMPRRTSSPTTKCVASCEIMIPPGVRHCCPARHTASTWG